MSDKHPKVRNGLFIVPACPICGQAPEIAEVFDFEQPDMSYVIRCPNTQHRPIYMLAPTPELAALGWWQVVEWIETEPDKRRVLREIEERRL